MNRSHLLLILITLISITLGEYAAAASATVRQEFAVGKGPTIQLRNFNGNVRISPASSDKITVEYTSADDRIEVALSQRGYFVEARVDYQSVVLTDNAQVDFNIQVPHEVRLLINNTMGSISVSGVSGKIGLHSVAGSITLENASGDIVLKTVGGDITLRDIHEAELKAETISGQLEFSAQDFSGESYEFENISGNIILNHGSEASYFLDAATTTGSIENNVGNETVYSSVDPVVTVDQDDYFNQFNRFDDSLMSGITRLIGGFNRNFRSVRVKATTISGRIILELD